VITLSIPYYSNKTFLAKAIQSAITQTSPEWRLIVVDDFSPDGADGSIKQLIESYADSRISYLRNERNLGLAGSFNRCIDVAETDLVTIFHSDDELDAKYVERFIELGEQYPDAVAFFCRARIIDADSRPSVTVADSVKAFFDRGNTGITQVSGVPGVAKLLRANTIVCPTVCYRKSVLKQQRFSTELRMVLDMEFTTRNLMLGRAMIGTSDQLYRYRRHSFNTTNTLSKNLVRTREECWLWNKLGDELRAKGALTESRIAYKKTIVKLTLLFFIAADLPKLKVSDALVKVRFLPQLWRKS
jgi:glycosyltransferase involved in cell wall biosynthesis